MISSSRASIKTDDNLHIFSFFKAFSTTSKMSKILIFIAVIAAAAAQEYRAQEFIAGHWDRSPRSNFNVAAACANSPDWSSFCAKSPSCELNSQIVVS
jgi:uncharacterized protein (DUF2147 family)